MTVIRKMLLFLVLSSMLYGNQALPDSKTSESSPPTVGCSSQRSAMTIVYTCCFTTFLCAWVAVHPNIPPVGECGWRALLRRLRLMIWTVVAPELILAWAVRQWLVAAEVAETYNQHKNLVPVKRSFIKEFLTGYKNEPSRWTRLHGHFLIMGGFILSEPLEPTSGRLSTGRNRNPIPKIANILAPSRGQLNPTTPDSDPVGSVSDQPYRALSIGDPGLHLAAQPASSRRNSFVDQVSNSSQYPPLPPGASPPDPNLAIQTCFPELEVEDKRQDYPFFLTYELLEVLLEVDGLDFNIPTTAEEIVDKSKGDFVTKVITCFQVLWFILQSVARVPQGLYITKLELITLALASQNAAMYFFWLDKPLNVTDPIRIKLRRRLTDEERTISDTSKQGTLFRILLDQNVSEDQEWKSAGDHILRIIRNIPSKHDLAIRFPWPFLLFRWLLALPSYILQFLLVSIYGRVFTSLSISLLHIIFTDNINSNAIHVPTFYAPRSKKQTIRHLVFMVIFGVIFSGIHLLGWELHRDQNPNTQNLWRGWSLYMLAPILAGIPISYVITHVIYWQFYLGIL